MNGQEKRTGRKGGPLKLASGVNWGNLGSELGMTDGSVPLASFHVARSETEHPLEGGSTEGRSKEYKS